MICPRCGGCGRMMVSYRRQFVKRLTCRGSGRIDDEIPPSPLPRDEDGRHRPRLAEEEGEE